MWRLSFHALDTNVTVHGTCARLERHVRALTATYATATAEGELRYELATAGGPRLLRNGRTIRVTEQDLDLVPAFEFDLYHRLVARRRSSGWLVHGAALALHDRAMLLVGASGNGKSTLALGLIGRGARYLSDDCSFVDRDGTVTGLARPVSFANGRCRHPIPAGFERKSYPLRIGEDAVVRPLLLHPPAERLEQRSAKLAAIFSLRYRPRERPGLRRLSAGEAFCQLWSSSLVGGRDTCETLAALLCNYPAYQLTTRTIGTACSSIERLATAGPRSRPAA